MNCGESLFHEKAKTISKFLDEKKTYLYGVFFWQYARLLAMNMNLIHG